MNRISALLLGALMATACLASPGNAQSTDPLLDQADVAAKAIEGKMLSWRRDIHAHPELGNMEIRTSQLVAAHLKKLGLHVRTGVGGTGVVGVIDSGKPGPVVALRADMDALPVKEQTDLPFASKATALYRGGSVPVMHACGHDAHVAILMATAEVLASLRPQLVGKVVLIFQPAEEGPATFEPGTGPSWGAKAMVQQGAMTMPKVDAIFGLHVFAGLPAGTLAWRPGPFMASADAFTTVVHGRQTHGAMPWRGIDPIVTSAQIINGLQPIISRQIDITNQPAILTIGKIAGGVRFNIIPDTVSLEGTIRTFDEGMRKDIQTRIGATAEHIAAASGGTTDTKITQLYDVTVNDPDLVERMAPVLKQVAGIGNWNDQVKMSTGSEDFSEYGKIAPSIFFFLGVTPRDKINGAASNHSPLFQIDESGLLKGVEALSHLAISYLSTARPST